MLIKKHVKSVIREQDVTSESVCKNRRLILKGLGLSAATLALDTSSLSSVSANTLKPLTAKKAQNPQGLVLTPESKVTTYNNFYEFGLGKNDPARLAQNFKSEPWTLRIDGEVNKPQTIDVWQLIRKTSLEERIYRMRCVEAWSMVIPWLGISLASLLKTVQPTSKAKYVAFQTLYDTKQFPGQKSLSGGIKYPYVEGLRIDEAMHPLTFLAVGLYGKTLPAQNGAPIRLVVPWKYAFKNIKSIVSIKLVEKMPITTWNQLAPKEYGFFANVNPKVDHPRWSQASERLIGDGGLFGSKRQATLAFNGYPEVAKLYQGMDLRKWI